MPQAKSRKVTTSRSRATASKRRSTSKKTSSWNPKRKDRRNLIIVVLVFALIGAFFLIRSFAASTSVSSFCGSKQCFTSSGFVYDQNNQPVAGVTLNDCHGDKVQTASDGSYAYTLPKYWGYCTRVVALPAGVSGPVIAYNARPEAGPNAGSYEWQVIGAQCYHNTTYCGNGKIGGNDAVTLYDMSPENILNFHVTRSTPPPPGCIAPASSLPAANGGMSYVNWTFNRRFSSYKIAVTIGNNVTTPYGYYVQGYDGWIDNHGQYFGIQAENLAIFSEFGTNDPGSIRLGPNAISVISTETGSPFISIRLKNFPFKAGTYTLQVRRADFDGTGDWFNYYVATPGQTGDGAYIGALRFLRQTAGVPASYQDGGGSWIEYYGPPINPIQIQKLNVAFNYPLTDGAYSPVTGRVTYNPPFPNTN